VSNLSDLIPAGASGKTIEAVATATIASKAPVILNSAGTVTEVGESVGSESIGSPVVASATTTLYGNSAVYDAASGKMVLVYSGKAPTTDTWAVVGTISGTVISWGTPVSVSGTITPDDDPKICYDPDTEQVIIAYAVQSSQTYVVTGKVSGTTISVGTPVAIDSTANARFWAVAYNVADSKGLVIYGMPYESSNGGRAKVITVTGTAISLGAVNNWNALTGAPLSAFNACYDSNAEKIVFAHSAIYDGAAMVFTISGTTVSAGSAAKISTGGVTNTSITYDAVSQKVVCANKETGSPYGTASVGTVSGTSISFGSPVTYESSAITVASVGCAYGGTAAGAVTNITFSPTSDNYMRYINGTVSGTSISFNTAARAFSDNATTSRGGASTATEGKVLIRIAPASTVGALVDNYVSGAVLQNVATTSNLTATNFVGIADAGISTSATGTIVVQGGTVTGLSSLTTGSKYYVQDDGTITTVSSSVNAGLALSTTSLLLNGDS
jgi:hypothetical protein